MRMRLLGGVVAALLVIATCWPQFQHHVVAAEIARYQPIPPPPISARAVFVVDATTGTALFALNPDEPLPPASLTKIVAALVILDEANLDDEVEIIEADLVPPEESQVGLIAGDRLTVRDLLYGVLIPSGNDATLALARHIGEARLGTSATPEEAVAEFVSLMNAKAAELGATASHFTYPTGIDAEGHVMSARDVATVTTVALQDPLFAEIVATPRATLASELLPDGYPITTTNQLLLEGVVNGVKTGTTPQAGGCLVTSYPMGPNEVIAVVLGSRISESADGFQDNSARFADTRALMNAVSSAYLWLDPAAPGAVTGLAEEMSVWDVSLPDDRYLPVPAASATQLRYRLVLDPPAEPASPAGEVQFFVDDQLMAELPALQAS